MEAERIVKHVGNYQNVVYLILSLCRTGRFTLEALLDYLRETQNNFCPALESGIIKTVGEVGQGYYGTVGPIELCGIDENPEKCGELSELCVSFGKSGNFSVFSQGIVKKILEIFPFSYKPTTIISTNSGLREIDLKLIPHHQFVAERYMEAVTNNLANLLYDSGQNPHVVKTHGCYSCGNDLHLLMEYAELGNMKDFQFPKSRHLIDSFILQSLMASFSLYHHGGMLHIDAHLGNHFLKKFSCSEPETSFYCGVDLYRKRYLHYTNLPERIFGVTDLLIDTRDYLVKLGDYGLMITDLNQAHNPYLKCKTRFSGLGEIGETFSALTLSRFEKHVKGMIGADLYSNIAVDFFAKKNSSGPFYLFLFGLLRQLKNQKHSYSRKLEEKIYTILSKLGVAHATFTERAPFSRSGPRLFEDYMAPILEVFSHQFTFDDRKFAYIGDPRQLLKKDWQKFSLEIDWQGYYKDSVFKSLSTFNDSLECLDTQGELNCTEKEVTAAKFSPEAQLSDSFSMKEIEKLYASDKYEINIIRDFPVENDEEYTYASYTLNSAGKPWPPNLRDKKLRGLYLIHIKPDSAKIRVDMFSGLDLAGTSSQVAEDSLAINGNYFLVDSNINNALSNIQQGASMKNPLGISYISDTDSYHVNPFPPIYNPWLVYVCIRFDGKHELFTVDELENSEKFYTVPFNYCFPKEESGLSHDIILTRTIQVPDLRFFASKFGYRYIYQTGPVLVNNKTDSKFTLEDLDREFIFDEKDLDKTISVVTSAREKSDIDPRSLLGKRYCVFAKNVDQKFQPDKGYHLFVRKNNKVPTLYGMNHSNLFVNQNILLCYTDGSFEFLLVSGRGYGSEGIDRVQLTRFIQSRFSQGLLMAIPLDGGFSANAVLKTETQTGGNSYLYALQDPEKRAIGLSYLLH